MRAEPTAYCGWLHLAVGILAVLTSWKVTAQSPPETGPAIQANSNRVPAGKLEHGILTLRLELRQGDWYPEADTGPSMKVYAFGEEGEALQVPGPLIRVAESTEIHVTLHNLLATTAVVHGLHQHPGDAKAVVEVPPQGTRELRFAAGAAGTYQYYASAGGDPGDSGRPFREDSQLAGAFVVDRPGEAAPDRILVLGIWRSGSDFAALRGQGPTLPHIIPVINGKSWPYTERLTYAAGEPVRWRWINASDGGHPMHMHGSYFRVDSAGDSETDHVFAPGQQRTVATLLPPHTRTERPITDACSVTLPATCRSKPVFSTPPRILAWEESGWVAVLPLPTAAGIFSSPPTTASSTEIRLLSPTMTSATAS